jgi:rod shape-determining protein MreD
MSRIALTSGDMRMKRVRRQYVPVGSTIAAALLVLLPIVATAAYIPDFAFLTLVAWRLLRPEMWTATTPCRSAC